MSDIECYVNGVLQKDQEEEEVKEEVITRDTGGQQNGHIQHNSGATGGQQNGQTQHSSGYERFPLRRPDNLSTEQRKLSARVRLEDEDEEVRSTAGRRLRPSCPGFPSGDLEHLDDDDFGDGGDGGGAVHAVHVSHRYGASDGVKFHSALSFFKTLEKQS